MSTRDTLLAAALKILEDAGEGHFSARAVCAAAQVKAPTLYHYFGSTDGLLSAAIAAAFGQLLDRKKAAAVSELPATALRQGWDDYVQFAATRPKLYAAMMGRLLDGAQIEAANQAYEALLRNVEDIAARNELAMSPQAAADLVWSSANAAALLHVTAQLRNTAPPQPSVIERIRDGAMQLILISSSPMPQAG